MQRPARRVLWAHQSSLLSPPSTHRCGPNCLPKAARLAVLHRRCESVCHCKREGNKDRDKMNAIHIRAVPSRMGDDQKLQTLQTGKIVHKGFAGHAEVPEKHLKSKDIHNPNTTNSPKHQNTAFHHSGPAPPKESAVASWGSIDMACNILSTRARPELLTNSLQAPPNKPWLSFHGCCCWDCPVKLLGRHERLCNNSKATR